MRFILAEIAEPLIRRVGTAVSTGLIGYGIAEPTVTTITMGVVAALGVGMDLLLSHAARKGR